jgi:nickel transport protein
VYTISQTDPYQVWMRDVLVRALLVIICCLFFSGSVYAHRVMIFGWVEGDRVMTQSKFSSNRVVQRGEISVYDSTGNRILTGQTDTQGEYSFQIPAQEQLRIVLATAGGHQAEWTITKEELESVSQIHSHADNDQTQSQSQAPVSGNCQQEVREAAFAEMLDRKLSPMMRHIAESSQIHTSLRDILGGIGYIIGLVGLVAYMRSRQKEKQGS